MIEALYGITFLLLTLSVVITSIRLFIGPSLADRVVAMDLITTQVIALIAVYSTMSKTQLFMDVAMVLALIAFIGTIGFAHYLEIRSKQ